MLRQKPDLEDWRALYEAASAFKKQGCWKWMTDQHLFGVQNPDDGQIGYCCVLGQLGEVFALNVYTGADGLASLLNMRESENADSFDLIGMQKCLMASFDDRGDLDPSNLKIIKQLELKFRGSGEWPNFLTYDPGYVPWKLTTTYQVRFLTFCLTQTVELAGRYRSRIDDLLPDEDGKMLILVPKGNDLNRTWEETRMIPSGIEEALNSSEYRAASVDELRLNRVRKNVKGQAGVWEVDAFLAPLPIGDRGRPYFPGFGLIVDQAGGQILAHEMAEGPGEKVDAAEMLLLIMERHRVMPEQIWVARKEIYYSLIPLMEKCDIPLVPVDELPVMQDVRESLFQQLAHR